MLTFFALPGPAMKADMSNSRLLTTGRIFMCWSSTPEKLLMLSNSATLCSEVILVRSASRITVSTVTGSSLLQANGCKSSSLVTWLDASWAVSESRWSSGCTSMEKTSEDGEDFDWLEMDTEM